MKNVFVLVTGLLISLTALASDTGKAMTEFPEGMFKGQYKVVRDGGTVAMVTMEVSRLENKPNTLQFHIESTDGSHGTGILALEFLEDGTCVEARSFMPEHRRARGTCQNNQVHLKNNFSETDYTTTDYVWDGETLTYRSVWYRKGGQPGGDVTEVLLHRSHGEHKH